MMRRYMKPILLVVTTVTLQSCSYGTYAKETFTPLTETIPVCEKQPDIVELYFDGEKTDFDYVKIGLVQIEGAKDTPQLELINKFKKLAQSKCADAIIGIKKMYKTRESGLLFIDEKPEEYSSEVFYGIAIRKS